MVADTVPKSSTFIMKSKRCLVSISGAHKFFVKLIIFLTTFGFSYYIICYYQQPSDQFIDYPAENEHSPQDVIKNVEIDARYAEIYRKKFNLPKNLKYILLWTREDFAPFYYLETGQRAFIKNDCPMINCYVTSDRNFFGEDLTQFHAVAFNGRNLHSFTKNDLPQMRSAQQKYIYFNTESSDNVPICEKFFNGFFNWTATYKLSSDIVFKYFLIEDKNGHIIGPKQNMTWLKEMDEVDDNIVEGFQNKTKAVAWFVSNCYTKSNREVFASNLGKELLQYGLGLDVYGDCGNFICPRYRKEDCENMLGSDYYFYLSLENSFAEDYVTEKLLTALQNNVIPVVYGGADYSRFVPPGSYLDGRRLSVRDLAKLMDHLIKSPRLYRNYFRWKKYYSYKLAMSDNVCSLCAALNDKNKYETISIYQDIDKWWNIPKQQNFPTVIKNEYED